MDPLSLGSEFDADPVRFLAWLVELLGARQGDLRAPPALWLSLCERAGELVERMWQALGLVSGSAFEDVKWFRHSLHGDCELTIVRPGTWERLGLDTTEVQSLLSEPAEQWRVDIAQEKATEPDASHGLGTAGTASGQ